MTKHAGISDEAVSKATGRDWAAWIAVLDGAGAVTRTHKEIAQLLHHELGVASGWWAQMISVGYEQEKGLREVHQKLDGYVASASRTLPIGIQAASAAWHDAALRQTWLTEPFTIDTSTPEKSIRIAWPDGTRVDVHLSAKAPTKTQVAIQHSKLADPDAVAMRKTFWREALDRLQAALPKATK